MSMGEKKGVAESSGLLVSQTQSLRRSGTAPRRRFGYPQPPATA